MKYADRGLVNDRYYYNMNMSLFNILFWLSNIVLFAINQGIVWAHFVKDEKSLFENGYRFSQIVPYYTNIMQSYILKSSSVQDGTNKWFEVQS